MASVSFQEFKNRANEAIIILLSVSIVSVIKMIKFGYSHEYTAILIASVICMIYVFKLLNIAEKYTALGFNTSSINETLKFIIIIILSCLSFYLFFVKGAYGIYLLFSKFSLKILVKKTAILIVSFRLVTCTAEIQTVSKSTELNS